jgi:hypothetical protein
MDPNVIFGPSQPAQYGYQSFSQYAKPNAMQTNKLKVKLQALSSDPGF